MDSLVLDGPRKRAQDVERCRIELLDSVSSGAQSSSIRKALISPRWNDYAAHQQAGQVRHGPFDLVDKEVAKRRAEAARLARDQNQRRWSIGGIRRAG